MDSTLLGMSDASIDLTSVEKVYQMDKIALGNAVETPQTFLVSAETNTKQVDFVVNRRFCNESSCEPFASSSSTTWNHTTAQLTVVDIRNRLDASSVADGILFTLINNQSQGPLASFLKMSWSQCTPAACLKSASAMRTLNRGAAQPNKRKPCSKSSNGR